MTDLDDLDREAAAVRASGTLGSTVLAQLFDFLVKTSRDGAPKEIDIATAVFGKPDTTDLSADATVRVYIHRLRRKLADYYAHATGPVTLEIPRGGYRLIAVARPDAAAAARPPPPAPTGRRRWWPVAAAAVVAINLLLWFVAWPTSTAPKIDAARASPPWAAMLANGRPLAIVVGDYYIFGEVDPRRGVDRMVRDYGVNSRSDLDDLMMVHPALRQSYVDLDLTYLPAGTAQALRDLLTVVVRTDAERARTRIVLASQLSPATLKIANIVYVGYFSGMGPLLRNPAFAGSRFAVGATWDELIDTTSGQHYHSDQGGPEPPGAGSSHDFGYVSTFAGVDGNRFVIVAGMRDAAVMHAAAMVSTAAGLAEAGVRSGKATDFEALYDVEGVGRVNMDGKLITAAPLTAGRIWRTTDKAFPTR